MTEQDFYGTPQQPQGQDPMQALLAQLGLLSGAQDQQGLLNQRLGLAQQLRQPQNAQHSTGTGAAMGGLGDLLRSVAGGMKERDLTGQQDVLQRQTQDARTAYLAQLLRSGGGAGGQPGGQPPF